MTRKRIEVWLAGVAMVVVLAGCGADDGPSAAPASEGLLELAWPDGSPKQRLERRRKGDGWEEHGSFTSWHANGQKKEEGSWEAGRQTGPWRAWYEDGTPARTTLYEDGLPHGEQTSWHPNGKPKQKGTWARGRRVGTHVTWHANGNKKTEGTWEAGVQTGAWTEWYPNGKPRETGQWKDDARVGLWTRYYENGGKFARGRYEGRKPAGFWTIWDERGKLVTDRFAAKDIP